ncbi:terminase [Prauserella endophytica]|uniref:terminase n=1 Tax=Prauserella endophytica TaxID=1592324 RepID=UPI001E3E9405|nr:terminase [Prauserella endophytica]
MWTPPLVTGPPGPCGCGCALTPATSYGFGVDEFATEVIELPLDPWERWLVIHAGELLPDGRPRFRKVLVIVARQNGKTHVLVVLSLYWLFVEQRKLILGTSTNLDYARESWEKAVEIVEGIEELAVEVPRGGIRRVNGEQTLKTIDRCRYKIAASNRKGGRSLTIHRLILDELREHAKWDAWNAAYNAMNAVPDAQAFGITNQGDDSAVVLDSLRADAVEGEPPHEVIRVDGDPRLGLFEYSAPLGSEPDDPYALAMANPNLGRRIDLDSLLGDARRAKRNGGEELAQFLTEVLCIRVPNLDPAVSAEGWAAGNKPGTLEALRARVALCFDMSLDGKHATLAAAAMLPSGRVRVEIVAAWEDTATMWRELPGHVRRVRPRRFGWLPGGPSAAAHAYLADRKNRRGEWPPAGVEVEEITREVTAVCMGFADLVENAQVLHSDDPLLNAQVGGAEKLWQGDVWRFTRRGAGHVDATYAAAGAVHLARTLPATVGKPRIIVAGDSAEQVTPKAW